jgi:hypothetical protein
VCVCGARGIRWETQQGGGAQQGERGERLERGQVERIASLLPAASNPPALALPLESPRLPLPCDARLQSRGLELE